MSLRNRAAAIIMTAALGACAGQNQDAAVFRIYADAFDEVAVASAPLIDDVAAAVRASEAEAIDRGETVAGVVGARAFFLRAQKDLEALELAVALVNADEAAARRARVFDARRRVAGRVAALAASCAALVDARSALESGEADRAVPLAAYWARKIGQSVAGVSAPRPPQAPRPIR